MKTFQAELNIVWYFLFRLSSNFRQPPPASTSAQIPNQPPPHLRSSTKPRGPSNQPASKMGKTEPNVENSDDSE